MINLDYYLIPAEEGLVSRIIRGTRTMYLGTYPDTVAHKFNSLADIKKASTQIVYKDKLNALLAASLTYGNKIDRKTKAITLTPTSSKSLLDKMITLYEVKCENIEFYKYSKISPADCYTVAGKDIIEYKEGGEYKVSDIFKQYGAHIQIKDIVDGTDRKRILTAFISYLNKVVIADKLLKEYVTVHQKNDEYGEFIDGESDSVIIASVDGPRDPDELNILTGAITKYIELINTQSEKEVPICKKWKLADDWDKNEGFICIELR